jgi:transposase InsO family protein
MSQGLSRDQCLSITQMTKHQFYHKPLNSARRGRRPSTHVKQSIDGEERLVANAELELQMQIIDQNPDLQCGALRMSQHLQLKGYIVNKKKVARMMKALGIRGKNKRKSKQRDKLYVKYGSINPTVPLTYFQMDIKTHWLIKERRQAYTLTIIDTFTRQALGKYTGCSIKAGEVKLLIEQLIENHLEPAGRAWSEIEVIITNDNGPQFIADLLKDFLERNGIKQLFTHPYTPEENGYIESFHATMSAAVEREHINLEALRERLEIFYKNYNENRPHTATKGLPPNLFKRAWENDLVITCIVPKQGVKMRLRCPLYQIPEKLNQRELLAKRNRAQRSHLKIKSGEKTSSAYNQKAPVQTSPSVASCVANKVMKFELY